VRVHPNFTGPDYETGPDKSARRSGKVSRLPIKTLDIPTVRIWVEAAALSAHLKRIDSSDSVKVNIPA
jgi:hypothetical protein